MKKYFSISALALLTMLCFSIAFSSCESPSSKQEGDVKGSKPIVGSWNDLEYTRYNKDCACHLSFHSNGKGDETVVCGGEEEDTYSFAWSVNGNILLMDGEAEFIFKINGNKLYLYDIEDEDDYLVYERVK